MLALGNYNVESVGDGSFGLDGGSMFGIVPRPLWEKLIPADGQNRISLRANPLLLRGEGRVILVDAGMGDKWGEKDRRIYAIDKSREELVRSLGSRGVAPDEVTDVVLSHLHFDHAGGLTRLDREGRVVPTFPKARVHVQREAWEWSHAPSLRDRGSFRPDAWEYLDADPGLLELADGDGEVLPGVFVRSFRGHTPGIQTVKIVGAEETLVFATDLVPTSAHLSPAWHMAFDLNPLDAIEEKRQLVEEVLAEGSILYFVHDPEHRAVRLERDGRSRVRVAEDLPV